MKLRSGKVKRKDKIHLQIKRLKGEIQFYRATISVLRRSVFRLEGQNEDLLEEIKEYRNEYAELYNEKEEIEQELAALQND